MKGVRGSTMPCRADGCDRPGNGGHGLCGMHYQRWAKNGHLDAAKREQHGERSHAGPRSSEYGAWQNMRDRCHNANCKDYAYYGGRGIEVCERWRDSFQAFLTDVGRKPTKGHTLDRIDVNGDYEPGNVRWATRAEQQRNRRPYTLDGTKHPLANVIEAAGERHTIAGWARVLGVDRGVIRGRLKRGWDPVRSVTTPAGGAVRISTGAQEAP
jgi:hypothetical protein